MFHRSRLWLLKAAIALFAGVAFLQGSSARADYTLYLEISDNKGHDTGLLILGGPFGGAASPAPYFDGGVLFTEFTSLSVIVTANESPSGSFLNQVTISGVAKAGFPATNLLVKVLGGPPDVGFDSPTGVANAIVGVSSSSQLSLGGFTSATNVGTLAGQGVGPTTITTTPAGNSASTLVVLPASYSAEEDISVVGIVQNGKNTLNVTGTLSWTPVPEPATLLLVLTGLPVLGVGWLRRRGRKQ